MNKLLTIWRWLSPLENRRRLLGPRQDWIHSIGSEFGGRGDDSVDADLTQSGPTDSDRVERLGTPARQGQPSVVEDNVPKMNVFPPGKTTVNDSHSGSSEVIESSSDGVSGGTEIGATKAKKGWLEALKKHDQIQENVQSPPQETFASMLRNSAFIDIGDPVGKLVVGEVFTVVDDDLYIDFGWKFNAVCHRPKKRGMDYGLGSKVLLRINNLELCTKFLGDTKYTTLLEADCTIVRLLELPMEKENTHDL